MTDYRRAQKTRKIPSNHSEGTHDDRFWALALAVYAAVQAPVSSKPMIQTIKFSDQKKDVEGRLESLFFYMFIPSAFICL